MRVVAVVPAYNEEATVGAVIRGLRQNVTAVVVVDDGSVDATSDAALAEGAAIVRHFLNRGQGAALQTGITYALGLGADAVVTVDADGQHEAGDIPALVAPIRQGLADVVFGSRFLGDGARYVPPARRMLLRIAVWFDRLRTGLPLTDTHNGLRALRADAARAITIRQDGMAHASELLDEVVRCQLQFVEVPVRIRYTDYSRAKGQGWWQAGKIVRDLLFSRLFR
ncbi:MAG: glycosyl transferase [Parcubacteria group bacterium Gr01-1014_31]|nr:MAG: glycosyl transferase [Parcubacteria group bacterium Gr01-1014_31]